MSNPPVPSRRYFLSGAALGLIAPGAASACSAQEGKRDCPSPTEFMARGAGAISRSMQDKLQDTVSAKDFGALGDGERHPLSERFTTLAKAKAVYPHVSSLEQSLDWAAIQAALNAVRGVNAGGRVILPSGYYVLSDSLQLPSWVTFEGESRHSSVLQNQYHTLRGPQMINQDRTAFNYVTIRNIAGFGGTHFLNVQATSPVADFVGEGLTCNLQGDANLTFSSLQTAAIRDCELKGACRHGLEVLGFPCNSVHLFNTRIGEKSDASIKLRGFDGFYMIGGSIEAGGHAGDGKYTIDLEPGQVYGEMARFFAVYFEGTHEYLLHSQGCNTVGFDACQFTGVASGNADRFHGADLIHFGSNWFKLDTVGPTNMFVAGQNRNLITTGSNVWASLDRGSGQFCSSSRRLASLAPVSLLRFVRRNVETARTNLQNVTGTLVVRLSGFTPNGTAIFVSRRYLVTASGAASRPIEMYVTATDTIGDTGAASVTIDLRPRPDSTAATAILAARFGGIDVKAPSVFSFAFDYSGHSAIPGAEFDVVPAGGEAA